MSWRPFPTERLPAPIGQFVREGATAIGCDDSYIALPLLTALGAAIGNSRWIFLKRRWREPTVLWTAIVGDSGTLKSPAMDLALHSVRNRQRLLFGEYEDRRVLYEQDISEWKAQKKSVRGDQPPEPTPLEHVYCSDTTVEALADRLASSPRGILIAVDELSLWLGGMDRYKSGKLGSDIPHYLAMHRAGALKVDRKSGSKPTIFVPHAAVSITGSIQPATLRRALTPDLFDNGLVARLLLAMPPRVPKEWSEADIDDHLVSMIDAIFDRLYRLQMTAHAGEQVPVELSITSVARDIWIDFYNRHAQEMVAPQMTGHLASAWSKLEAYAARFALIHACVRQAADEDSDGQARGPVNENDVEAGIKLVQWFKDETWRVYCMLQETEDEQEQRELLELIADEGGIVTPRRIKERSRRYPTSREAHAVLDLFVEQGLGSWAWRNLPGGGRPSKVFCLADSPDRPVRSVPETPAAKPQQGFSELEQWNGRTD